MTRIIGGRVGGRTIAVPRGAATRPTSDRVREALFSMLVARDLIAGARVLDLYAGSGALGLEAVSRGAASADLVEADRPTARLIERNARDLGIPARVHAMTVRAFARRPVVAPADLVFADPPYPLAETDLAADLAALVDAGWLAPGALLVLERSSRSPEPCWPDGMTATGSRRYGETTLWLAEAG